MAWFNKNDTPQGNTEAVHDSRIEVVVTKEANKEVAELAKEANEKLNTLLVQNHFTLKIFLAAGGKVKPKGKK